MFNFFRGRTYDGFLFRRHIQQADFTAAPQADHNPARFLFLRGIVIQLRLIFSQPQGGFEQAQSWLDRAQKSCAREDWTKAIQAYDKSQSLLEGLQNYVNLRGEVLVYIAYCHLLLHQLDQGDSYCRQGLALVTDEDLRTRLEQSYRSQRLSVAPRSTRKMSKI